MIPMVLFAMARPADVAGPPPSPPVAPVSLTRSYYAGGRSQFDVVLGDAKAHTKIYIAGALQVTLDPGVTYWAAGFVGTPATATHYKGGLESSATPEGGA